MKIKEWAEEDRPREKMLLKGIASLSDAELLAILIGSGNSRETAVQLSQRILNSVNNNLNALGKLSVKELMSKFKGIGKVKAITINAALELGKRRGNSCFETEAIYNQHDPLYTRRWWRHLFAWVRYISNRKYPYIPPEKRPPMMKN